MSDDDDKPTNVLEFKRRGEDNEESFLSCPECGCPYWTISDNYLTQCAWCDWELNGEEDDY